MGEKEDKVDIFHPLAELHWEECCELPESMYHSQCVSLHGKIYVGGGYTSSGDPYKLFISSDLKSWNIFNTPTKYYALTTYHSQLVLIGGMERNEYCTNKVWTTGAERIEWLSSLPPMRISRRSSSAINTQSKQNQAECIIVTGGLKTPGVRLNTVEVFVQGEWSIVQPLPLQCFCIKCTIHDEILYLMGSYQQDNSVLYCELDSLLSSNDTLWKTFRVPLYYSSCVTFHRHLVSVGGSSTSPLSKIYAYSPLTRSWLHVGDLPFELESTTSTVISTGELVVIGGRTTNTSNSRKVYKASLKVSPFNLESRFSMLALSKLEYAGVQIITSLKAVLNQLTAHIGVTYPEVSVKQAIVEWESGRSRFSPTWKSLFSVLKNLNQEELSQQIEDYLYGKPVNLYLAAYHQILKTRGSLDMIFLKMVFVGSPRLGKTSARRRLTGEIVDISSAGEPEQPSTGTVESGRTVVIRNLTSTTAVVTPTEWFAINNLTEEASMLLEFIYGHSRQLNEDDEVSSVNNASIPKTKTDLDQNVNSSSSAPFSNSEFDSPNSALISSSPKQSDIFKSRGMGMEIANLFRKVMDSKYWKDIKHLFKYTALIRMEDTGGQPEFMDMLPALTIGPALYLLFCKLIDELQSRYTVSYLSPSEGQSTTPVESTYTVEEVLLTALAGVACLSSHSSSEVSNDEDSISPLTKQHELLSSSKSIAYIVGTHKDLVSDQQVAEFDEKLQRIVRSTDFFHKDLVQFSSENRMVLPIDNMTGGMEEIKKIQKFLAESIQQHFKKLSIPAAWLVLSIWLRKRAERIISLQDCLQLAEQLGMTSEELKLALWFLHHYAGVLMYFPDLPELKDTVICDIQIVYDSVTNLIVNTFRFGPVSKANAEKFRETGQFSLEDIRGATASISGDYIPLDQLVKLLEYLNIIAPLVHPDPECSDKNPKIVYFMPCVLHNAPKEELQTCQKNDSHSVLPASLMIRYECGFVPLGLFPATIANLVGNDSFTLIVKGIKKNQVQFRFGADHDKVTFISRPHYYEIHITRQAAAVTKTHEVCGAVREIIESTIKTVTSRMNYAFTASYQLAFECPSHPGRDHLCVVNSRETSPHMMDCLFNIKDPQPLVMQRQHMVWFGKPMNGDGDDISGPYPTYRSLVSTNPLWDKDITMNYLQLIKYLDPETGECREIRILDDLAPYWKKIAELLGIRPSTIKSIAKQGSDIDCLRDVIGEWLANAPQMPHCKHYSEKWRGLHNLLKDGRMGKLAADMEAAFDAEKSSVHGNYEEDSGTLASSHASLPTSHSHIPSAVVTLQPGLQDNVNPSHLLYMRPHPLVLCKELWSISEEWKEVGLFLNLEEKKLKEVEKHGTTSQSCMKEMLKVWLAREQPPPTWVAIIEVLDFLEHEELALTLRRKAS